VILDEGTFADFIEEDDDLIAIHTFEDVAERAIWLWEHVPRREKR